MRTLHKLKGKLPSLRKRQEILTSVSAQLRNQSSSKKHLLDMHTQLKNSKKNNQPKLDKFRICVSLISLWASPPRSTILPQIITTSSPVTSKVHLLTGRRHRKTVSKRTECHTMTLVEITWTTIPSLRTNFTHMT